MILTVCCCCLSSNLSVHLSSLLLSQSLETALKYCNYFFTSTFVIEASLKLVAFGFRRFFKDRYSPGCTKSLKHAKLIKICYSIGPRHQQQVNPCTVHILVLYTTALSLIFLPNREAAACCGQLSSERRQEKNTRSQIQGQNLHTQITL